MSGKPLDWIDEELDRLRSADLLRTLRERDGGAPAGSIVIDGEPFVNFGANDYLGLASEPRLAEAAVAAARTGWGAGASPLVTGRTAAHARLERRLAEFEGAEAALLFTCGYAANLAAVTCLASQGDVIFSDARNHASIIDGCRLSRAEVQVYPHADIDELRRRLERAAGFRRRLIVTDALFSMGGDIAPLEKLAALADEHQAMLLTDEAHATGVFGRRGRGVCEHLGVEDGVHARVGTLSKALGSVGGFVVGPRKLIDLIANRGRSYVFSTAAPAAAAAASLAAIEIVVNEPHRRSELLANAANVRERLVSAGWNIAASASQIIPVVVGEPSKALALSSRLRGAGIFVPAIRPPSVPSGESLLRISLSYDHSPDQIELLIGTLVNGSKGVTR